MKKRNLVNTKWIAALAAGMMLSLATVGSVFAAEASKPIGPGAAVKQEVEAVKPDTLGYWVQTEGIWYFYHEDGTPALGWIKDKGKDYYLTEGGRLVVNTITPDGYFVNRNGEWFQRKTTIFEEAFAAPQKFPSVNDEWAGKASLEALNKKIDALFFNRKIKITEHAVEYVSDALGKEEVLLGAYKDTSDGSYRFDIRISLEPSSTSKTKPATYDYMVFRALMYQLTSTPEQLEDAIYSSWEENNRWNISRDHWVWVGDAWVKYTAGSGAGYYYVYPVGPQ